MLIGTSSVVEFYSESFPDLLSDKIGYKDTKYGNRNSLLLS